MIEWKYRWSRKRLEDHLLHLGLYEVEPSGKRMDRKPTLLVDTYRRFIADSSTAIGEVASLEAVATGRVA